jgi:hypothetical protein
MLKSLLCAVLLLAGGSAWAAQVVGVVAHLSGPLLDRKADGSVKVLGPKSEIENGDTLVSEKNTYAQIRFVDNSEITLKPGTTFHVENFNYDAGKPDADSAAFNLVKGGLRSITGLLGKRNKEKFSLKTPSATIGIRGTTFIVQYVPPPAPTGMRVNHDVSSIDAADTGKAPLPGTAQGKVVIDRSPQGNGGSPAAVQGQLAPPAAPVSPARDLQGLAPGLHLQVTDGMIVVSNGGGAQQFAAGQFGFVPNMTQPPVIVPHNSGLLFTPPPAFSGAPAGPTASTGGSPEKQGVDCIVR